MAIGRTIAYEESGAGFGVSPKDERIVNFTWSAYGLGPSLTARNTKDVYIRVSQKVNLERGQKAPKRIEMYEGQNQLNYGSSQSSFLGTIDEPFYRAGGDVRSRYRKMEVFGVGLVGHDNNHTVDTVAKSISNAPAVTYTGGSRAAISGFTHG